MTPVLVTPPAGELVDMEQLKLQCRTDGPEEEQLLAGYVAAAIGWLDGWGGLLGRAILPQSWALDVTAAGRVRLPMPDVVAVSAEYATGAEPLALSIDAGGAVVEVTGPCRLLFDCAMPEPKRALAVQAVMLLAATWFRFRETVGTASMNELPFGVRALVQALRWRRV